MGFILTTWSLGERAELSPLKLDGERESERMRGEKAAV